MKLLKHRCNTVASILEAKELGFDGVEIDLVWGWGGDIVVNHEHHGSGISLTEAVYIAAIQNGLAMALNVKEYGMAPIIEPIVRSCPTLEYFVFDVPGPELHEYSHRGLLVMHRQSEYEVPTVPTGVVVDSFLNNDTFIDSCVHHWCHKKTAVIGKSVRGEVERTPVPEPTYLICKEKPCNPSSSTSMES